MKSPIERKIFKVVSVASIGGGLEMYDFVIYAFFAPILAKLFLPATDDLTELLRIFTVFALGYFVRPLGAMVFGHYSDRVGRKKILLFTIVLMAVATTAIGLLPTYQSIGMSATLLLIFFRLLQGFAVGGDLPGAITFVAEHVDKSRRGLYCSWIYTGVNLGFTLASVVSASIAAILTPDQQTLFGWRIAFLFGLVLTVVGYYLRSQLSETPKFILAEEKKLLRRFPIRYVFKQEFLPFLQGVGIVCLGAVVVGHMLFMPSYLHLVAGLSLRQSLFFNTAGMIVWSGFILWMGHLSDKWGRKKIIGFSAITLILFSYELYWLIATAKIAYIILALLIFAVCMSGIIGAFASTLSELFSTPVRNSGLGLAYNLGFALFCSVTPLVMTSLIQRFGALAPSFWVIAAAIITLSTCFTIPESISKEL